MVGKNAGDTVIAPGETNIQGSTRTASGTNLTACVPYGFAWAAAAADPVAASVLLPDSPAPAVARWRLRRAVHPRRESARH